MRRLAVPLFVLAVVLGAIVVLVARGSGASATPGRYTVDVIFDTAKGVIPGQVAKIAGARVGSIQAVDLTPDYKARIELSVDARFAPFRTDATCSIKPEGLISERFIECDPGTQDAPPLRGHGDVPPTVPVTRTTVPVSLTDLFNILDVPAQQRLSVLISSFGGGLAGHGDELNAVLLRAAPALQDVRHVLDTLRTQRAALGQAVVATDRAVGELAAHRRSVRAFIGSSSRFLGRAASRQAELSDAIRRLPPLLDAARPALDRLGTTAAATTPVLGDLRAAAPWLAHVLGALPAFSRNGGAAVRRLGVAAGTGIEAVDRVSPVLPLLETFAAAGLPTGGSLARTLVSLRDSGTLDGALSFLYNGGATLALYDDISHIGATRLTSNACVPNLPAQANPALCPNDAAQVPGPPARRRRRATATPPAVAPSAPAAPHAPAPPRRPGLPTVKVPALPALPAPPQDAKQAAKLLNWLLG